MNGPAPTVRPVLEARGIVKSFPGVRALDGVNLLVYPGRVHAVLGENGAGKSTLMNILAGVFPPDSGTVLLDGRPVRFGSPRQAQEAGIAIIFQELSIVDVLTVAENVYLGREPVTAAGLIDYARMNESAGRLLARLDPAIRPDALAGELRVAQQQIVEIARALSLRARIIIMDEPTSALTAQETEALFRLIGELKRDGVAVIYITHRLEEVRRLADDVTVLRDGRVVASGPAAGFSIDQIIRLMVGREVAEQFRYESCATGDVLFRAEAVTLFGFGRGHRRKPIVDGVSFEVCRGEVLGVFGLLGARRTELLESVFGLHPGRATGRLWLDGRTFFPRTPAEAIRAGLVLAPEDRKNAGLILEMSVCENTTLAVLDRFVRLGLIRCGAETEFVQGYVDRLRIKTPSVRQKVRNLSGGTQQKVVLAKWLATAPRVLLLDEPTRGIDVNAKREIYGLINELARAGMGIVLVSSELPEIMALADRVMVMCEGRKTAEFRRAEATEERIMEAALP